MFGEYLWIGRKSYRISLIIYWRYDNFRKILKKIQNFVLVCECLVTFLNLIFSWRVLRILILRCGGSGTYHGYVPKSCASLISSADKTSMARVISPANSLLKECLHLVSLIKDNYDCCCSS